MQAQALFDLGLHHKIGGIDYNFRYKTQGQAMVADMRALEQALSQPVTVMYSGQQTHGANIEYCDGSNGEDFIYGRTFDQTDGLITDQIGVGLLIKFADCTPILLYDPVAKVQACVHSGWRGTQQRIGALAVDRMVQDFGAQRDRILAYIGPSIDQANYEVGAEVYEAFADFSQRDLFFKEGRLPGKYQLSMAEANYQILLEAGLSNQQIIRSSLSTYESIDRLHSARREGADYGLNAILSVMC